MKALTFGDWWWSSVLWLKVTMGNLWTKDRKKELSMTTSEMVRLHEENQKATTQLISSLNKNHTKKNIGNNDIALDSLTPFTDKPSPLDASQSIQAASTNSASIKRGSITPPLNSLATRYGEEIVKDGDGNVNIDFKDAVDITHFTTELMKQRVENHLQDFPETEPVLSQKAWHEAAVESAKLNEPIHIHEHPSNGNIKTSAPIDNSDLDDLLKKATKVTAGVVQKRYYVSSYYPLGLSFLGRKTNFPVLELNGVYDLEIEDLLRQRQKKEPYTLMGTKEEIKSRFKRLKDVDFENAISINEIRKERLVGFAHRVAFEGDEAVHLFRHWFCQQVKDGKIKSIDGHHFVDLFDEHGTLIVKADSKPEDFLYCHFNSLELARKIKYGSEYYSVNYLAQILMQRVLEHSFGIRTGDLQSLFEIPNTVMKLHSPSGKVNTKEFTVKGETNLKGE